MACRSLTIHTHDTIPHKWVVHFRLRHSHVHPPRQVSMTLKLSQLRAKLESGIEFYDGAFFLEFLEHINFTVSRSGAPFLRSPPRTLSSLPHFACGVHPALCAGSKLIIHPVHPERAAASLAGAGAPRAPIRLVWALAQPRHSQLLARRRAARDSLKGSRRSRAPRPPSFRQLSHRARLFACTFSLAVSRSLGRCLGRLVS